MYSAKCEFSGVAVALLSLFLAQVVVAEEPLEEIIVTADFRERSIAEVPLSITVLDRAMIEQAAVQHFEELIYN